MELSLRVLGCAGSHPGVGRLCSGYLLQVDKTSVMLDAGNGSTANLQRYVAFRDLDAVVATHRHVDHCIDLVGAYYARRFDPAVTDPLPLYAAPEVHDTLAGLTSADSAMGFDEVFAHQVVGDGDRIRIGPLTLSFADSLHPVPAVSVRAEVGGRIIVYSGDSAGGDQLRSVADGADLFLCEATWAGDADAYPTGLHLTARGAAEIARDAAVERLVLTHIAGGTDREQVYAEAREVFDGPLEVAEDLDHYLLS